MLTFSTSLFCSVLPTCYSCETLVNGFLCARKSHAFSWLCTISSRSHYCDPETENNSSVLVQTPWALPLLHLSHTNQKHRKGCEELGGNARLLGAIGARFRSPSASSLVQQALSRKTNLLPVGLLCSKNTVHKGIWIMSPLFFRSAFYQYYCNLLPHCKGSCS